MKRRVLGKGIEAIIANKPNLNENGDYIEVDIDNIYPNPYQPRKKFRKEKILELAASLKENGMIQPVVLYRDSNKYFLLVGERRWRSAQQLKWEKIPAIVKDVTPKEVMVAALVENVQREDLNAVEIAEGINLIIEKNHLSQEEASVKVGMNRTTVTNYLRLLKLPEAVKQSIISGEISQGHARALLGLDNVEAILDVMSIILKGTLSVRETEKLVKKTNEKPATESGGITEIEQDPDLRKAEESLSKIFSSKVNLIYKKNGSGKIVVYFSNLEEYERIHKLITKE
ncbi:MAG: ParB/RepB/Spo0J family partition protein [Candidatus Aminicenantes bacterium]|nr:ParB/RepB/Spo0J family partition protein [Candidatus Aminicenantes bacterium]